MILVIATYNCKVIEPKTVVAPNFSNKDPQGPKPKFNISKIDTSLMFKISIIKNFTHS